MTISQPASGVEVVSISGSTRCWRDAHTGFTLALVHRGQEGLRAQWKTRGRSMAASSGDIMAIEPGDVHVTERLQVSPQGADFDLVRLSPALLADVAQHLGARTAFHFKSPTMAEPRAFDALRTLVDALAEGRDACDVEASCAHAAEAVVTWLAESPTRPMRPAVVDYRLRRLRDYLHAHLTRRPTLTELEAVAELSRWRICIPRLNRNMK